MAKKSVAEKYDMTVSEQKPGESDLKYYKRLAKVADRRLARLEEYSKQKNFEGVLNYAYARAKYDIRSLSGNAEAKWFDVMPAKTASGAINVRNLQARINAVKKFLESPTSTKRGITKVYKERVSTINQRYGVDLTWQEMAAYYSSSMAEKLQNDYKASKTIIRAIGALKRFGDDPEKIKKAIEGDIKVSSDAVVNEIATSLLSQGLTFSDLTSE